MLAAYPVLLPMYMMRYDWKVPSVPDKIALTCIIQAHSRHGLAYVDIGTRETGEIFRKSLGLTPGSWIYKFSHAADDLQAWDLICGISFGFSSLGIPGNPPGLDKTVRAIKDSVDEKIRSKSNMDVLAEYGVNMDHPCVRMCTREEVDANRRFLVASGKRSALHKIIRGLSARQNRMNLQTDGKRVVRPEAAQKDLNERMNVMEKQRDDLKPQWVQDWEDSRGQGRSVPP